MGSEKQSTSTSTQTKVLPTPEEQAMQKMQLDQFKQTSGPQTQAQLSGLQLINQLLSGGTNLPGIFGQLAGGISSNAIGTQASQLAKKSMPGFQQAGIQDSGEAERSIANDIAQSILFPAEQFNIGSLQNLLNLALSGQAQVQAPIQAGTNTLSQSLAGLRSTQSSGSSTQTSMNPFLKSFQQGAGTTMGGAIGGGLTGGLPGFGAGGMFAG